MSAVTDCQDPIITQKGAAGRFSALTADSANIQLNGENANNLRFMAEGGVIRTLTDSYGQIRTMEGKTEKQSISCKLATIKSYCKYC